MKLMICGSRSITEIDLSPYVPHECELIITGGEAGVDTVAEEYADHHGIPKTAVRKNRKKYGKTAPAMQIEQMVNMADAVLAVREGGSSDTDYAIRYAARQKKPVILITNE